MSLPNCCEVIHSRCFLFDLLASLSWKQKFRNQLVNFYRKLLTTSWAYHSWFVSLHFCTAKQQGTHCTSKRKQTNKENLESQSRSLPPTWLCYKETFHICHYSGISRGLNRNCHMSYPWPYSGEMNRLGMNPLPLWSTHELLERWIGQSLLYWFPPTALNSGMPTMWYAILFCLTRGFGASFILAQKYMPLDMQWNDRWDIF